MRISKKQRFDNYYNCLLDLKKSIDEGNIKNIGVLTSKHRVSKTLASVLVSNGVIFKQHGFYIWNQRIPPTMLLAKKVITQIDEHLAFITNEKKRTIEVAIEMNRQPKKQTNFHDLGLSKNKNKSQKKKKKQKIGLIRRFIRWIY